MASLFKISNVITFFTIFQAGTAMPLATAQNQSTTHFARSSCDFGTPSPSNWPAPYGMQWCQMIENEVSGLKNTENPAILIPHVDSLYKQAGIKAACDSALPNIDQIMADRQARAALQQMKTNYPAFGSMDLTPENIQAVYKDAIEKANKKSGVPKDIIGKIIWTESKGHPLVPGTLTQIDYVAWGQMADQDSNLKNRYMPNDNIVAAASYLALQNKLFGGDWETTYSNHYQDPGAIARASATA